MGLITRRQLLGAAAGATLLGSGLALPAAGLTINPRSSWGSAHPPKGPLDSEDVKFLIVHHSASRNGHTGADVPGILRSWFNYHTGPDKGWNDIAYNFIVDSEGGIWEGREGSIAGPVAGDATGGNQGFTQLVCVIGDYNTAQPTQSSRSSLVLLLAWLADRYGVSTSSGSEVTFISRGSNLWPAGTSVTTPTITGHRTMSKTTCPGDNLYSYVAGGLSADVHAVRGGAPPSATTTTTAAPTTTTTVAATTTTAQATTTTPPSSTTTTAPPSTSTTFRPTTTVAPTTSTPQTSTTVTVPTTTTLPTPTTTLPVAAAAASAGGPGPGLLVGATALAAAGTGFLWWRWKRMGG